MTLREVLGVLAVVLAIGFGGGVAVGRLRRPPEVEPPSLSDEALALLAAEAERCIAAGNSMDVKRWIPVGVRSKPFAKVLGAAKDQGVHQPTEYHGANPFHLYTFANHPSPSGRKEGDRTLLILVDEVTGRFTKCYDTEVSW